MEHCYTVDVTWKNDRRGIMTSPELNDSIDVATPPQFPKGIEGIWSPEHLLTAAVNSCIMTTFLAIAENSKLDFLNFSSSSKGKLEMVDGKYMMSEIALYPVVTVSNETDKVKAERVLAKSEANCLISNSVRSKVLFYPEVKIATAK